MTTATLMLGRLRTLADVYQEVKHDMGQHKAPRTWLRDEEAKLDEVVESPRHVRETYDVCALVWSNQKGADTHCEAQPTSSDVKV